MANCGRCLHEVIAEIRPKKGGFVRLIRKREREPDQIASFSLIFGFRRDFGFAKVGKCSTSIGNSERKLLNGRTFGRGRSRVCPDEHFGRHVRHADPDELFLFDELEVVVEVVEHPDVASDVDENDGDEDEHDDDGHAMLT